METRLNPFDQSVRVSGLKNEKFSFFWFHLEKQLWNRLWEGKRPSCSWMTAIFRLSENQFAQPEERRLIRLPQILNTFILSLSTIQILQYIIHFNCPSLNHLIFENERVKF